MTNNIILLSNTSKAEPEHIVNSLGIDKFLGNLKFLKYLY